MLLHYGNRVEIPGDPPLAISADGVLIVPNDHDGGPSYVQVHEEHLNGVNPPSGFDRVYSVPAIGGGRVTVLRHRLTGCQLRLIWVGKEWWWEAANRIDSRRRS
jgi:hypothetical protein